MEAFKHRRGSFEISQFQVGLNVFPCPQETQQEAVSSVIIDA